MKSNGCESRPVKASEQAGSESCHSPGDWWVRSVDSKEAGREDSAPSAATLAAVPAGASPVGGNCPVATVVISGNGEGDQIVESPDVKASVREASNLVGRSKGELVSPEII